MIPDTVPLWVAWLALVAGGCIGVLVAALMAANARAEAVDRAYLRGQADALTAPATEALIRGVAVATVELVAEEYRDQPTLMMACREHIAGRILEATQGAAKDFGGNAA